MICRQHRIYQIHQSGMQMGTLPNLELMRVAVNGIRDVPESFSELHKLAWFSLAGNPACAEARPPR